MRMTISRKGKFLLRQIAVRRLKKSRETILLSLGMLFSVLLVAFFLFFTITVKQGTTALVQGLPHIEFVNSAADGMSAAAGLLTVATILSVRTWAGMSMDASAQTVAVLHSLGATPAQRRYLLWIELSLQYLPSLLIGTTIGAAGGIWMSYAWIKPDTEENLLTNLSAAYVLLWLVILLVSGGLLVLCYTIPHIHIKRLTPSITESLRRRGQSVSAETHSYRRSNTYKRQSLLKRLAGKSVDFYKTRYGRLAMSLAVSALYPVLATLLIYHLLDITVTLDTNPFDGINTVEAVISSVRGLLTVIALGFLLLTAQGVWGGILLIRAQWEQRKQTGRAYLAMGMTDRDFKRIMHLEMRSLLLRSGIYLLIFTLIANFYILRMT